MWDRVQQFGTKVREFDGFVLYRMPNRDLYLFRPDRGYCTYHPA